MYSVILRSSKPEAKAFKRWITHEVIPTIRQTGSYHVPISEADLLVRLAQANLAQVQRISVWEQRVGELSLPTAQDKFLSSLKIAQILGRKHNQVLRRIRNVLKHAEVDGIYTQDHIQTAYRRDKNNARQLYYTLDLDGISLFSQSLRNKLLAQKLEEAWKMIQEAD